MMRFGWILLVLMTCGCQSASQLSEQNGDAAKDAGQLESALAYYNEAAKSGGKRWQLFEKRARIQLKLDEFKKAEEDFSKAIELSKTSEALLLGRAEARLRIARYAACIRDLNQVIAANDQHHVAYSMRGEARMDRMQYAGAVKDLSAALRLKQGHVAYLILRGRIFLAQKELEKSERDFTTVIENDPSNAYAFWNRAIVRERRGLAVLAKADREQAGQLNPTFTVSQSSVGKSVLGDLKDRASNITPIEVDVKQKE